MITLDYIYYINSEVDSIIFVLKLILTTVGVGFLFYIVIKLIKNLLLIGPIIYVVCGALYCLVILLTEIKNFDDTKMRPISRRPEYFNDHIYVIVFILNISCGILRISGTLCMILLRYYNNKFEIRCKLLLLKPILVFNEMNEDLVQANLLGNKQNNNIIPNESSNFQRRDLSNVIIFIIQNSTNSYISTPFKRLSKKSSGDFGSNIKL